MLDYILDIIFSIPVIPLILISIFLIVLYFLPTIIAELNKKRQQNAILVLNIFIGWTFLGWVACLVWSVLKDNPTTNKGKDG